MAYKKQLRKISKAQKKVYVTGSLSYNQIQALYRKRKISRQAYMNFMKKWNNY